jgi:hypothetical protein
MLSHAAAGYVTVIVTVSQEPVLFLRAEAGEPGITDT